MSVPTYKLFIKFKSMVTPKQPLDNHGTICIRFTHGGVRFLLGKLGQFDDKIAYTKAESICKQIAADIASGNFRCANNAELALRYNPSSIDTFVKKAEKGIKQSIEEVKAQNDELIAFLEERLKKQYHSSDKILLKRLQNYKSTISTKKDAEVFIEWLKKTYNLAPATIQRYLNTLKVASPLFSGLKVKNGAKPQPKPFTREEVRQITNWFENSKHYKPYSDFVKFLFWTGCRTSEAIGLQWKHIDFNRNLMFIYEALGRDGDNTSKRIRKTTKTNVMRTFPLSNGLLAMLKERYVTSTYTSVNAEQPKPESLVFPSPTGKSIDDHNFSQRIWNKCLKELNIEHRPQYNTRHTFISYFLEETKDVIKCASLTHGTQSGIQTIYKHYAAIINKFEIPNLY
jgi:integrase